MYYDVDYEDLLNCYCLHYAGEMICLTALNITDAQVEAESIVANWY